MKQTEPSLPIQMYEGNLRAWIEQESIHLKAIDPCGDPLELTSDEARMLAEQLTKLADRLEEHR